VKVLSFANILSVSVAIAVSTYNLFVKSLSITGIEALVILLLKVFEPVKVLSFANMLSVSVAIAVSTYNLFVKCVSIDGAVATITFSLTIIFSLTIRSFENRHYHIPPSLKLLSH
jgi:hypothetical protein